MRKIRAYIDFVRPFTLLAPFIGFISAGLAASGATRQPIFASSALTSIGLGAIMAALLNAASNGINQIFDQNIDAVNKPHRPLPSGRMGLSESLVLTLLALASALYLAWHVGPVGGQHECFFIVLLASVLICAYSIPPIRTKQRGLLANVTISLPRGLFLVTAGWSSVSTLLAPEPWYLGSIFFLFLLGSTTSKDFADIPGDQAGGCRTLPIRFGFQRSARLISPSFVVPFLLLPLGAVSGILRGNSILLATLGVLLALYGGFLARTIIAKAELLATAKNHPAWVHMYIMMLMAQIGIAAAYLI